MHPVSLCYLTFYTRSGIIDRLSQENLAAFFLLTSSLRWRSPEYDTPASSVCSVRRAAVETDE
jgi:hypothetical protein